MLDLQNRQQLPSCWQGKTEGGSKSQKKRVGYITNDKMALVRVNSRNQYIIGIGGVHLKVKCKTALPTHKHTVWNVPVLLPLKSISLVVNHRHNHMQINDGIFPPFFHVSRFAVPPLPLSPSLTPTAILFLRSTWIHRDSVLHFAPEMKTWRINHALKCCFTST